MSRTDDEIESVCFHTSLAKRASAIIVRKAHAELNFACLCAQSRSGSQCSSSNHCGKPLSSIQRSIFAHDVALHQKSTRALISIVLDALTVLVILPKVVELMFVFGTSHWGLLRMFIASARSVNMVFSVRRRRLVAAMSRPSELGPVTPGKFRAVLPVVPGSGFFRTTLPEASTTTWFVNLPGSVASPPKFGAGELCVLRFEKYCTNPLPYSTLPLGRTPTRSAVLTLARMPNVFIGEVNVSGGPESHENIPASSHPSTAR